MVDTQADLFQAAAQEFVARRTSDCRPGQVHRRALRRLHSQRLVHAAGRGANSEIPWDKIFFFWSDERHVPPDDPESNYRMANEAMLSKVPVLQRTSSGFPPKKKMPTSRPASMSDHQQIFRLRPGEFPRFDLILLGIGPDGHTASLFPGSAGLEEKSRLVIANWVEKFNTFRITFTYPVLNHAACVMFLASGPDKAAVLHEVLEDPASNLPCQRVRPGDGSLIWLLDRAAASGLAQPGLKVS